MNWFFFLQKKVCVNEKNENRERQRDRQKENFERENETYRLFVILGLLYLVRRVLFARYSVRVPFLGASFLVHLVHFRVWLSDDTLHLGSSRAFLVTMRPRHEHVQHPTIL